MRYRLMCGTMMSEIPANEFQFVVSEGFAIPSRKDPKLAHVKPRYKLWIDRQTGILALALADRPERDPYAIPSSFYLIIKHAMLFGAPNETLFAWHDQVYAGCALGEPVH